MHVLTSVDQLADVGDEPVVILASSADDSHLIDQAAEFLGLPADAAARVPWGSLRVSAHAAGDACAVSLVVARPDTSLAAVQVVGAASGLLIVADAEQLPDSVTEAAADQESPQAGLVALLGEIARVSEDNLIGFADRTQQGWDTGRSVLTRVQRRAALTVRRALLTVNGLFDAQQSILDEAGDVASWLGDDQQRPLAAVRHRLDYVSEGAYRLYAAAGDELSQQSTLVTEQLTIVNTVFLPLTLGASFFGMNFGWLTRHIGSATSFVLLGVLVPAMLAVLTVLAMRRLERRSVDPDG